MVSLPSSMTWNIDGCIGLVRLRQRTLSVPSVIMDLVILILIKGKVTDLPSTPFHHSLPTLLPHLYKLDHEYSSLSACLRELLRSCEEKLEVEHKFDFDCVIEKFRICINLMHPK